MHTSLTSVWRFTLLHSSVCILTLEWRHVLIGDSPLVREVKTKNRTQAISLVATHSKHDSKVKSKGFQMAGLIHLLLQPTRARQAPSTPINLHLINPYFSVNILPNIMKNWRHGEMSRQYILLYVNFYRFIPNIIVTCNQAYKPFFSFKYV